MSRFRISWLLLLAVLAAFLISCSPDTSFNKTPPALGNLNIVLDGIESAEITVAHEGNMTFQGVVNSAHFIPNLTPGTYAVDGMPVSGMLDPTGEYVKVEASSTTNVTLVYLKPTGGTPGQPPGTPPVPPKAVKTLEVVAVKDDSGQLLPAIKEVNSLKDVMLYAAQTEENVCVKVKATDDQGKAVVGAQLSVTIADGSGVADRIAIIRGCAPKASLQPASFRDSIFTDADGLAKFTLYATFGVPDPTFDLLNVPAKLVVAAENANGTMALTEFKAFFFNISHLYLNGSYTGSRVGKSFTETNIFNPRGPNAFEIKAELYQLQPRTALAIASLGHIRFEVISELDKDGKPADVVDIEGCDAGLTAGLNDVCTHDKDAVIRLVPKATIGLRDLPIEATVKATLFVELNYGDQPYGFALKDFTVTKRWVGSYLSISKVVDNHVLTWAGPEHHLYEATEPRNLPDHTLAAIDDPAITSGGVFTTTYRITVENEGTEPVYDLTIADALPAELGLIKSSLNPAGATYDGVNHVVTWNFMAVADGRFDKLEPGESITATVEVYIRQKPGFCMDAEDVRAAVNYQVQPIGTALNRSYCYEDPYAVINGAAVDDVTATFYTGNHLGQGGHQVKIDFHGAINKADVILHAVRPIFSIDKQLIDPPMPMETGQVAYFDITIKNPTRLRYNQLEASYPDEFTGPRFNPYGRNVQVKDVFDTGLDFVSAAPLKVGSSNYSVQFIRDKAALWDTVALMNYRAEGTTRIALRANLPSPGGMPTMKPVCIGTNCIEPKDDYWYNCAFLDADNLNQPETTWNQDRDWTQLEQRPWDAEPLHHSMHANLRYGIRDCAKVTVVPPPGEPWLELDSLSEYDGANPNTANRVANVRDNDNYYYYLTVTNIGQGIARNVSLETKLDCAGDPAQLTPNTSSHSLWQYNTATSSWDFVAYASFAGLDGVCTVRFAARDLGFGNPEPVFLYVIEATATASGNASITARATYTNPVQQAGFLPLVTTEVTSIAP